MNICFLIKNSKDQRQYREFYKYLDEEEINYYVVNTVADIDFALSDLSIICSDPKTIILLKLHCITQAKKCSIIYRSRGLSPEESYFKNKNYFKYIVLSFIELLTIASSDTILFVSKNHREYVKKKYKIQNNGAIIHNYNLDFDFQGSNSKPRITYNICYAGSLSKWQNTDVVLDMFSRLYHYNKNLKFYFFTDAIGGISANISKKYTFVEFNECDESQLDESLKKMDFGVIIREDLSLNKVASPFKIIDYLTAGLRIISTDNIGDYKELFENNNVFYFDSYKNYVIGHNIKELNRFILASISENDIRDINMKINIRKEFDVFFKNDL